MSEVGKLLARAEAPHETRGDLYLYWCPGCRTHHQIIVGPGWWGYDGNEEAPTLEGSALVRGGKDDAGLVCHSFIRAGQIEFLTDSTHDLAGQTVPMTPFGHLRTHRRG